jgi:hypothetical protein
MIMRGPLTQANRFTAEGWALRLRGWIFTGLALLLLAVWGLWEMRAQ